MTISNNCRLGAIFDGNYTTSFAPDELSTFDQIGPTPAAIDFAHMDCLPSNIVLKPGQSYEPLVTPPPSLKSGLKNKFGQYCDIFVEAGNWKDPIVYLSSVVGGISGPGPVGILGPFGPDLGPPHRLRRDPANAHETPWAPASTTMPS